MENHLLVLGNGFDKAMGLKTGYKEFLDSEYFKKLSKDSESIISGGGLIRTLEVRNSLSTWVDVELAIKQFAVEVSRNNIGDEHAQKIKIEFFNLKKSLESYLIKVVSETLMNHRNTFVSFSEKFTGVPLDVISFNYTETFSLVADRMKHVFTNVKSILDIHGTLQDNNIIFGIDGTDLSMISEKLTFLEKESNPNYQPKKVAQMLSNAKEIFFYGVSIGETDSRYYRPFFKNLLNSGIERKIYFSFYDEVGLQYLHNRLKDYTSNNVHELKSNHDICFFDCQKKRFI